MKFSPTARIRLISIAITLVAILFLGKLAYLQTVKSDYYSDLADRQYLRPASRMFERGSIFFTNKDGSLFSAATLKQGFFVAINPGKIVNPEATYSALSAIFPLDRDSFLNKAGKTDDPYEEIATRLDPASAEKIKKLELPGVTVYKEKWRFYPGGKLAAHAVGFMAYSGDDYAGRYGLERQYDDILKRGQEGSFVNYFAEIFLSVGQSFFSTAQPKREGSVVTTIEPTVQTALEKQMLSIKDEWHPDLLGGIIMDPKTGEIFALAVDPAFNPGEKQENLNSLSNPLVERVYEMGSIFKPLTMAAGIDSGAVTPKTRYFDKGFIVLNTAKISNFDGKGRGDIDMQEVLNKSLNTGAAFVAGQMGHDTFRKYMLNYGLGEKTGIDLPDEVSGLVSNLDSTRDIEYATASFGQGVAVSPLEMTRALASLGNGGYLVTPHLVKEVKYEGGVTKKTNLPLGQRVLKPETSTDITRMLVTVVDKSLAGGTASLPHYRIAAKTGTAQIAKPEGGGYYEDRYLHSFFGYFPAYEPRFIVFLYMVYPKGAKYASETLTKPFLDLSKFLISYYEVPPDR
jgi:cell division protein FtsI/penicillin-binding protein 2